MTTVEKFSVPVNFDLSFLKIRWSDHLFIKVRNKIVGEGVVYGGNWKRAERLARQMAKMKFEVGSGGLPICEQIFINHKSYIKNQIQEIWNRGSNLKLKVGRDVIKDIKVIKFIRNELKFPNKIRIDANQGYSLKQLQYLIPTLVDLGIEYVEEPVKVENLPAAAELLHRYGLKIILDESLNLIDIIKIIKVIDAINIKLSRIGDINEAIHLIKLCKKSRKKVVIGCSEELERGMKAIYALGHIAKKEEILLEVEGFGPLRLAGKFLAVPRWVNRLENLNLMLWHRIRQTMFDLWQPGARAVVLGIKRTKLLSALSLRLVKITGKSEHAVHPKHLIKNASDANFLDYIQKGDRVLDVGCGNGQNTIKAAKKAGEVIGFDYDKRAIELAKVTAESEKVRNINFGIGSAEARLSHPTENFDKVLFLGVLEHLKNRELAISEVHRVLKYGGRLILGIPNSNTGWKILQRRFGLNSFTDPDHKIEYSKQQIEKMLTENDFRVEKLLPTAYDTPWAGIIDIVGGISLNVYEKLLKWKWAMARKYPKESISYLVVAQKT